MIYIPKNIEKNILKYVPKLYEYMENEDFDALQDDLSSAIITLGLDGPSGEPNDLCYFLEGLYDSMLYAWETEGGTVEEVEQNRKAKENGKR